MVSCATRAGSGQAPGGIYTCFDASNDNDGGTFAHELGHNFHLSDRGSQAGDADAFCKPNYRSLMNYAVSSQSHDFSSGEFLNLPLNPSQMDEQFGLGTTDPTLLDHITSGTFQYLTGPAGQIDWNRNGIFDQGLVRAAATWTWSSCRIGGYQFDQGVWAGRAGSAFAWLPTSSGDRLYWFTRRESDGYIEYRYATSFPIGCTTPPLSTCKTTWVPALGQPAYSLAATGSGAPAVARFWDPSIIGYKLVLAYRDANGSMRSRTLSPSSGLWSAVVSFPGGLSVQGDVAAAMYNDKAYVYASTAGNNTLYKWSLSSSTGKWSWPASQVWATGGSVLALHGIGVTSGQYRSAGVGFTRMFAAIPIVAPAGKLVFAWNDATASNTWTKLPEADWVIGLQYTKAQPGLAYAPMDPDEPTGPGRFYVAWTPRDLVGPPVEPQPMHMAMTEGNDLTSLTTQQLRWEPVIAKLESNWSYGSANISLHYDLDYDRNMRAAFTMEYGTGGSTYRALTFEPFADGIFDNVIKDQDDYPIIWDNLDVWPLD